MKSAADDFETINAMQNAVRGSRLEPILVWLLRQLRVEISRVIGNLRADPRRQLDCFSLRVQFDLGDD